MAGIAKSAANPAHMNWSLIGSQRSESDQANTHPLKKRVLLGSVKDPWDPQTPISNRPIRALRAVHFSRQAGHAVTGSPHPQCKLQPTGAQESPRRASEPPRPKESQSPELNSVSTDNRKAREHTHHPRRNLPLTPIGPRAHQECGSSPSPHHLPTTKSVHSDEQLPIGINVTPTNPRDPVNTK